MGIFGRYKNAPNRVAVSKYGGCVKALRYTTNKEAHAYMLHRKNQNLLSSKQNKNENWFAKKLKIEHLEHTRQAQWGYRLFDFWIHHIGIAIEIDGPEHDPEYDSYRDEYNFRRSAIIVLRVKNRNEDDAEKAINFINKEITWKERRDRFGLLKHTKKEKRLLADLPYPPSLLKEYILNGSIVLEGLLL